MEDKRERLAAEIVTYRLETYIISNMIVPSSETG